MSPEGHAFCEAVQKTRSTCFIIWLCLKRTGNNRIHEFDWLKSILTAVNVFPSRLASRLDIRRSLEFGYPPREETAGRVSDRLCL